MSSDIVLLQRQAQTLLDDGRLTDAMALYWQLTQQHPDLADAWYNLGYVARRLGHPEQALAAYARALACGIAHPEEVHLNRAVILSDDLRRSAQAAAELQQALALRPDYPAALLNLGNLHEENGQRTDAIACYQRLLQSRSGAPDLHSLQGEALARLAHLTPPRDRDDPLLARLEQTAAQVPDPITQSNLLFALGRACDRLADTDRAFAAFSRANQILLQQAPPYDPRASADLFDALKTGFAQPVVPASNAAPPSPQPLFICGLHRSGSTLLEQVLAAHPQVYPGGELQLLPTLIPGRTLTLPDGLLAARDPAHADTLATAYLQRLRQLFPDAGGQRYLTDKRPDNVLLIGWIKHLFPRAKIIHTVRDLRDNGLSLYMQPLHPSLAPYACTLDGIGHYMQQCRRLVAHWKSLYPDDVLEFDYDAFVRTPEPVLRQLLEALELPWDPACLHFHRLDNTVKTASYWQVREPLHASASGRWQRYRHHLQPLLTALATV